MTRIIIRKNGIERGVIRVAAIINAYPAADASQDERDAIEYARNEVASGVKPSRLIARMSERGYEVEVIKR